MQVNDLLEKKMYFQNFKLFSVTLLCLNITISIFGESVKGYNKSISLSLNETNNANTKPKGKTLFGILGFLSGYRLGQGSHPTSYSSDVRETAHVNLHTKLFNAALYFYYDKHPNSYNYPSYSQYPPYPQNIYPTHLQPPIWYPPVISPQGHNPTNQQQIINLHEPFNPNEAPHENYQELHGHNSQDINNNFNNNRPSLTESIDKIDTEMQDSNVTSANSTIVKRAFDTCENSTCAEDISSETDTIISNSSFSNSDYVTEMFQNVTETADSSPNVTSTESPKNDSQTGIYPYPTYHNYENASKYEQISITENPDNFLKHYHHSEDYDYPQHLYYQRLPHYSDDEIIVPYPDVARENSFRPMGGSYYESRPKYFDYVERFNKKQEESDFVPMFVDSNRL